MSTAIFAAPSHADPTRAYRDYEFINQLYRDGVILTPGSDTDQAIEYAHIVCSWRYGGRSKIDIVNTTRGENSGLSQSGARLFVLLAIQTYCPDEQFIPADLAALGPP